MNDLKPMSKQDMFVSCERPLISQIMPSRDIINRVYITYNICETCNLN